MGVSRLRVWGLGISGLSTTFGLGLGLSCLVVWSFGHRFFEDNDTAQVRRGGGAWMRWCSLVLFGFLKASRRAVRVKGSNMQD